MTFQHPAENSEVITSEATDAGERASILIKQIREALHGLKNGQITISVHNGEVTMIDRILRKRHYRSRPTS